MYRKLYRTLNAEGESNEKTEIQTSKDVDKSSTPLLLDNTNPNEEKDESWKWRENPASSQTSSPSKSKTSPSEWEQEEWNSKPARANKSSKTKQNSSSNHSLKARDSGRSQEKKGKEGEKLLIDFGEENKSGNGETTDGNWGWDDDDCWDEVETSSKGYQRIGSKKD